jgi:hypothetical protein
MNVNFFVTCIGDALKSRMARDSVLLLEHLAAESISRRTSHAAASQLSTVVILPVLFLL